MVKHRLLILLAITALAATAVTAIAIWHPEPTATDYVLAPGETQAVSRENRKLSLFVSIDPQAYLLKRITGRHADIRVLVTAGQEPHNFEPSARQMTALVSADAYFTLGMPFETEQGLLIRLKDAAGPVQVIDAIRGIPRIKMGTGHDPHVWLSPTLAGKIASSMCEALCRMDATNARRYRDNLAALAADLAEVRTEIAATLADLPSREFMVFHPAFGYFADEFKLRQIAIEIEGKEPTQRQLTKIIEHGKQLKIKAIFVQPEFDTASAKAVAEAIGAGKPVVIDPMAGDYLANLRRIAKAIKKD